MTNVSLKVSEITFTFNDGDVDTCKGGVNTVIDNSIISGTGPMGAWNYDYEGSGKRINMSGVLTLADTNRTNTGTCKTILAQKQWLESLLNGQQQPITITSKYETESVLIKKKLTWIPNTSNSYLLLENNDYILLETTDKILLNDGEYDIFKGIFTETECMMESLSFEEESGNPNQLPFRMTLLVGEGISLIFSYLLNEDGNFMLLETGNYIIL